MNRLLWIVPLILVVLRLHNWEALPATRGFDNYSHRLVVESVALNHTFPLANQGFSGYQPPLYYMATGALWHLLGQPAMGPFKSAQLVSALASCLLLLCAFVVSRTLLPSASWYVVLALAAFPAEIMLAAMVYNISFGAAWAGLFLCILMRAWPRPRLVVWEELALGVTAGLTWMSRPDGACLGLVLGMLLLWRLWHGPAELRRNAIVAFVAACMCVGAICSWYLFRNLEHFGRPLVFNGDWDCLQYQADDPVHVPWFRTVSFYLGNDLRFFQDAQFPSQTPYFTGMTYASAWWAHIGFFYESIDKRHGPPLLVLGLVPTALSLWGLGFVLGDPERRRAWAPVLAMGLAAVIMYLVLVNGLPIFAVVKPAYLYVGFIPFAMLIGAGATALIQRWPRTAPWLTAWYSAFALYVTYVFWCR